MLYIYILVNFYQVRYYYLFIYIYIYLQFIFKSFINVKRNRRRK